MTVVVILIIMVMILLLLLLHTTATTGLPGMVHVSDTFLRLLFGREHAKQINGALLPFASGLKSEIAIGDIDVSLGTVALVWR